MTDRGRKESEMKRVIGILKVVFNYDFLYISGGNADKINFKLDDNIIIAGNRDGIKGGAKLWEQQNKMAAGNAKTSASVDEVQNFVV